MMSRSAHVLWLIHQSSHVKERAPLYVCPICHYVVLKVVSLFADDMPLDLSLVYKGDADDVAGNIARVSRQPCHQKLQEWLHQELQENCPRVFKRKIHYSTDPVRRVKELSGSRPVRKRRRQLCCLAAMQAWRRQACRAAPSRFGTPSPFTMRVSLDLRFDARSATRRRCVPNC